MLTTLSEKIQFIESVFGQSRSSRDRINVSVRCPRPECDSSRDSQKFKLAIRITDDANHCWVCGWRARSLLPLLLKHADAAAVATYRQKFYAGRLFDAPGVCERPALALPSDFRLLACAASNDSAAQAALTYVTKKRRLSDRDLWRFKLGVSDQHDWRERVIIPSFDRTGELNFFTSRAYRRGIVPYKNCDADKTSIVFNELHIDWTSRLVICEGPFDLFKCGENAVPLLGSNLTEDSALMDSILLKCTPVAIAIDSDMQEKALRMGQKLSEYGLDVVMVDFNGHHDPGEMTRSEFQHCLASAQSWTWQKALLTRLSRVTKLKMKL